MLLRESFFLNLSSIWDGRRTRMNEFDRCLSCPNAVRLEHLLDVRGAAIDVQETRFISLGDFISLLWLSLLLNLCYLTRVYMFVHDDGHDSISIMFMSWNNLLFYAGGGLRVNINFQVVSFFYSTRPPTISAKSSWQENYWNLSVNQLWLCLIEPRRCWWEPGDFLMKN